MKTFILFLLLITMSCITGFKTSAHTESPQKKESIQEEQETNIQPIKLKDETTQKEQKKVEENIQRNDNFPLLTLLFAFMIPVFIIIVFYLMFKVIKF